ncbi:MAG: hypothetical protein M1821_004066 [Bathelium mastoideum]|nr:MAG: hypothetical protein M1821_004066 [Bathelium mastoideum]KAI9691134.1 MAG: hypothetical protein M1822_008754 [Bathelium mastoideum]
MPFPRLPFPRPRHLLTLPHRTFTSAPLLRIKEDKAHDPDHLESVKQSQIKKQEQGKGHWHEELASAGESGVKADREREQVDDHDQHIEELQEHTKGKAEKGQI